MSKQTDFLRHIVNPVLSKYIGKRKNLTQSIDEIRKLLIDAEEKYGFSVFGGNPDKLIDYFKSDDFRILYRLLSSINNLDILREILIETRERYSSSQEIVNVINEILSRINREVKKEG